MNLRPLLIVALPLFFLSLLSFLNLQPFSVVTLTVLLSSTLLWSLGVVRSAAEEGVGVSMLQILVVWGATRSLSLVAGEPSVDDDVYRYLWDGARLLIDGEPFSKPPLAYFSEVLPTDLSWLADRLNYPGLATIYGPIWVVLGALGWSLTPSSLVGWKVLSIVVEFLLLLVARRWVERRLVFLGVTCPLWFWEVHLQSHAEIFGIGFWLLALLGIRRGHFLTAGFLLSLAVGGRWSMVVPIVVVAFFCRVQSKDRLQLFCGGALGVFLLGGLFFGMGPFDFTGFQALSEAWVFNPIVWKWFPSQPSIIWVLLLGVVLLLHERPWSYQIENIDIWSRLFAVWLLVSPVINPWYLLWLVPGFVAARTWSWWSLWLALIPIAYLQAQWMGDLDHPNGLHHNPAIVWWVQAGAMIWMGCRKGWLNYKEARVGS